MRTRLLQRLFRRSKPTKSGVSRGLAAYLSTSRRREVGFDQDIADYPAMCEPELSKPTVRITRVIDQSETLASWDDWGKTMTMETAAVSAKR